MRNKIQRFNYFFVVYLEWMERRVPKVMHQHVSKESNQEEPIDMDCKSLEHWIFFLEKKSPVKKQTGCLDVPSEASAR